MLNRSNGYRHAGNVEVEPLSNGALTRSQSSNYITSMQKSDIEGVLLKKSGKRSSWSEKYFVLHGNHLEYFSKAADSIPKKSIILDSKCTIGPVTEINQSGKVTFGVKISWLDHKQDGGEGAQLSSPVHSDSQDEQSVPNRQVTELTTDAEIQPLQSLIERSGRGVTNGNSVKSKLWKSSRLQRKRSAPLIGANPGSNTNAECFASMSASNVAGNARDGRKVDIPYVERNETLKQMVQQEREERGAVAALWNNRQKQNEREVASEDDDSTVKAAADAKLKAKLAMGMKVTAGVTAIVTFGMVTAGIGAVAVLPMLIGLATSSAGSAGYMEYKKRCFLWNRSPIQLSSPSKEIANLWHAALLNAVANCSNESSMRDLDGSALSPKYRNLKSANRFDDVNIRGRKLSDQRPPCLSATNLIEVASVLEKSRWKFATLLQGIRIFIESARQSKSKDVPEKCFSWLRGWSRWSPSLICRIAKGAATRAMGSLSSLVPMLRCQLVVRASPLETLMALLAGQEASEDSFAGELTGPEMGVPDFQRGAVTLGLRVLEMYDDNTDVVEYLTAPIRIAPGIWAAPRQFCLARHWRQDRNGCYVVCLDSTPHRLCPKPPKGYVRGTMNSLFTMAPRRISNASLTGVATPECMLTHYLRVDPCGWIWHLGGFQQQYAAQLLLQALDIREIIEAETFNQPSLSVQSAQIVKAKKSHTTNLFESPPNTPPCLSSGQIRSHSILEQNPTCPEELWGHIDASNFMLRGKNYLTDRVKIASEPSMFDLKAVDLFQVDEPIFHITSDPDNRIQRARRAGETGFVWAVQVMIPGPPHYAVVVYFTPKNNKSMESDTPFGRLARLVLLNGSSELLDNRLKMVPRITEGNWLVRRACPPTPAILGTKLRQVHYRGDRYLETDLEIASSSVAANITRLSVGYAKTLVVEMGWTIQGESEEQLPEVLLGGFKAVRLDLSLAEPFNTVKDKANIAS